MSEPEQDWVGRAIPPAPHWVVRPTWYGLFDHVTYASPTECFAANRTCRQDLVREPIPYHCRPVAKPDAQSAHPADVRNNRHSHVHAGSDIDSNEIRDTSDGGAGDGYGRSQDETVRHDDRRVGGGQAMFLADSDSDDSSASNTCSLRNANSIGVLSEGK